MDETRLAVLEKTGSTDVQELVAEVQLLRAHVAKLSMIIDGVTPCNDDCDAAAVVAWVDPADRYRVSELIDVREQWMTSAVVLLGQAADTIELAHGEPTTSTEKLRKHAASVPLGL